MDLSTLIPQGYKPSPAMNWSPQQLAVFEASKTGNLVIEAVAGSGKTTTVLEAMHHCDAPRQLFLAFNKSIADTLRNRVPWNVEARTFHSLGLSMLKGKKTVAGRKVLDIIKAETSREVFDECGYDAARAISRAKSICLGVYSPATRADFVQVVEEAEIYFNDSFEEQILNALPRWYNTSITIDPTLDLIIDFDDMLLFPLLLETKFPSFDVVFVDEAQDLNYIQHMFLEKLAERGARIIAVGDSHQAIYGFRGARSDSMSELAEMFSARTLPLSVSYRCSRSVVQEAQQYVAHIQPKPDAADGLVKWLEADPEPVEFQATDMVICRNNAPLFGLATQFLRARVPCQLRTSHGKELIKFIKGFKAKTPTELETKVNRWFEKEAKLASAKKQYYKIAFYEERRDIVLSFTEACDTIDKIVQSITSLLYSERGTVLCSIHKAKGLEAPRVFILRQQLMPSKWATTEEQLQQETNLRYVAITRSLDELYYFGDRT